MNMHHYREDFEQAGPDKLFEEEIARQYLAVARDANAIVRSASYAASAAAHAARLLAYIAVAALVIAISSLAVSVVTPAKIESYLARQLSSASPAR
jgi:hypothetical protein